MKKFLFRTALLLGAVAYLVSLGVSIAGQWMLDNPTPENLERGIRWDPRNSSLWARYARQWHFLASSAESHRAVEGYKKAASLNPYDPSNWKELAAVHIERGDLDAAEAALRGELTAVPHAPQASWRMANLLLVRGRAAEAYPYLKAAAAQDRSLRVPVFDLAQRLEEDPDVILRELIPEAADVRADYLRFLVTRRMLHEAYPVWQEIADGSPETIRLGSFYVETLAAAGMGSDAARIWSGLLTLTGSTHLRPAGEFLTNGNFEAEIQNAGLGWRLTRGDGYQIALDGIAFQNGTRSVRVTFDGTANLDFAGVSQTVPVEPNRRYRLEAYLKTDGITTDNGLSFRVASQGAPRAEAFAVSTPNRVETMGWVREQLDFQTGPNTSVVVVQLRRFPSQKLNSLIQGKVWIDNLSLRLSEP